ncbi:hypothetical protein XELAEV_18041231mg [Xenopus laevis]|uniref:Uncharacterized protein n=1 Tax=Xenopus laevis TaxID=8355 RepID=A0A974C1S2_XENLA|nr:hypothetical protein XELAEV_18041231mg [Xenopus laevis]
MVWGRSKYFPGHFPEATRNKMNVLLSRPVTVMGKSTVSHSTGIIFRYSLKDADVNHREESSIFYFNF